MKYTLEDIFKQAETTDESTRMESRAETSHILHGIKLVLDKKTRSYKILNTTKGGDHYKELDSLEYMVFGNVGWLMGVYTMAKLNYKRKLDVIENRIRTETNARKNDKHMKSLKESRNRYMKKYAAVSKKKHIYLNH